MGDETTTSSQAPLKWSYKQTLLLTLLPLLLTNGAQMYEARQVKQRAVQRDELLASAFSSSVEALSSASASLATLEEQLAKCQRREPRVTASPAPDEGVMMRLEEQPAPPGVSDKASARVLTATQQLDLIAVRERYRLSSGVLASPPRNAESR